MRFNGFPWQSIIPKGMAGAPNDLAVNYKYDPQKAKQLLAEAGYPNGLKKKLFPAGAAASAEHRGCCRPAARPAGVELELVPGEHTPDFRARNFEVYMGNSGARLPDPFATAMHYAYNPDNRDEAKLGGYYLWRVAQDSPELLAARRQVQDGARSGEARGSVPADGRDLSQDGPCRLIVFFQRTDPYVVRKNVKGYLGHPTWSTRWSTVTKG